MARVYVSIGSNVDRAAHVRACVKALQQHYGTLVLSTVYETAAVGFEGGDFYNLVAGFDTTETPGEIVRYLKALEAAHGRDRSGPKFGPRTLDVDLLLYDEVVIRDGGLELPRDEITRYAFVLGPLAEVAGDRKDPLSGRLYGELWAEFDDKKQTLVPVPGVLDESVEVP